jgi:hypothetical protein
MSPITNKPSSSYKWLSRLGYVLALLGLLLFTPAADLLPVDVLSILQPEAQQTYFRVVPLRGEAFFIHPTFAVVGACLLLVGIAIVIVAWYGRRRSKP